MITSFASIYIVCAAIDSHVGCFIMDSLKMPLQDPTITHQLFQLIAEMSEDEKRTLLKLLKRGALKGKCRRQHFRKPLHMPVRYANKAGVSSGVIQDISLGGVFILSRGAFSLGQRLSITFSPANFEKTVWIACDVMRVTPEGIGVRFSSMNQVQKTAVISVASTQ
jgi:c-di-GMP-binding flagellar brake protein YcgR